MNDIQLTEEQQEALQRCFERIVEIAQKIMERIHAAILDIQHVFVAWIYPIYRWWTIIEPAYLEWQAQRRMEYWWIRSVQRQWILPE